MSPPLRVGSVPYLVGRPLDLGLGDEPGIELDYDVPARLVERLRAGELDVALVSSIELFRRPEYRYIDRLAVTGRGFVASVQVFLRKPLEEVRTLALDPSSRTAATLVQVLLARRSSAVEFVEVGAGNDPRDAGTDGWLRIGDEALREYLAGEHPVFNPSLEWTRSTGLPFVFAPWIVRPGAPIEPHVPAFVRAWRRGQAAVEQLAAQASREWKVSEEACLRYLGEECVYESEGEELQKALDAFRAGAAPLGLCRSELPATPVPLAANHAQAD